MSDRPARPFRYITDEEARTTHSMPGFVAYRAPDDALWLIEQDTFAEQVAAGNYDPARAIR